ncbi:hypothetical protein D3C71_1589180 [compost metagenome]
MPAASIRVSGNACAGSTDDSTASTQASSAAARQKLSWRLRFHSALPGSSSASASLWNASVCALLLHRLPPSPISAKASTGNHG